MLHSPEKALALEPDLEDAWSARGNVYKDCKRFDEAIAAYDRALSLNPDFAETWFGRGNVFFELNRYGDAVADYEAALARKGGAACPTIRPSAKAARSRRTRKGFALRPRPTSTVLSRTTGCLLGVLPDTAASSFRRPHHLPEPALSEDA